MKPYIVIQALNEVELTNEVNNLIEDGYEPVGSPVPGEYPYAYGKCWYQAMYCVPEPDWTLSPSHMEDWRQKMDGVMDVVNQVAEARKTDEAIRTDDQMDGYDGLGWKGAGDSPLDEARKWEVMWERSEERADRFFQIASDRFEKIMGMYGEIDALRKSLKEAEKERDEAVKRAERAEKLIEKEWWPNGRPTKERIDSLLNYGTSDAKSTQEGESQSDWEPSSWVRVRWTNSDARQIRVTLRTGPEYTKTYDADDWNVVDSNLEIYRDGTVIAEYPADQWKWVEAL